MAHLKMRYNFCPSFYFGLNLFSVFEHNLKSLDTAES